MNRLPMILLAALGVLLFACGGDGADATPTATIVVSTPPIAPSLEPTATTSVAPATATPAPQVSPTPGAATGDIAAAAAVDALASWLGPVGDAASIVIADIEAVTWPDGCLGLTRPGQACTDALVEGYRVTLTLAQASYEVRTDAAGDVTLWAPETPVTANFAQSDSGIFRFTMDGGGSIEAQAVPGTSFGIDETALTPGDAVTLGLADAPQGGGQLLVWLDP